MPKRLTEREKLERAVAEAESKVEEYGQWTAEKRYVNLTKKWKRKLKAAQDALDAYEEPVPLTPEERLAEEKRRIILDFQVWSGVHAWSPFGETWTAVTVRRTKRVLGKADRVDARTNERKGKANIRVTRLVRRDPEAKGDDKPTHTPDEVFAEQIKIEERAAQAAEERKARKGWLDRPEPEPEERADPEERAKRVERLLELLGDDATIDDW